MKYSLNFIFLLVCTQISASCSRKAEAHTHQAEKSYLVSQIISSCGYQGVIDPDACESAHYYENLFALFIFDEKRFFEITTFLHEKGQNLGPEGRSGVSKFHKILNAPNYECRMELAERSDYQVVRLLVNKKIVYVAIVSKSKSDCFINQNNFEKTYNKFLEGLMK